MRVPKCQIIYEQIPQQRGHETRLPVNYGFLFVYISFGFFNKYNSQFASVNTIFTRLHNSSCVKNYSSSKEYLPNVLDFNSRVNFNFLPSTLVSFLFEVFVRTQHSTWCKLANNWIIQFYNTLSHYQSFVVGKTILRNFQIQRCGTLTNTSWSIVMRAMTRTIISSIISKTNEGYTT